MKSTVYILLISSFLVACGKEATDPNTYRVTVKENFTDPLKQLENIQVDDYVPYTITLTDSKEGGEYRLTSLKEGERYHQTIGKDFVLSLTNDPKTPINKEQKYLSFSSKGTHSFYIRPLEPGTFKLTFELQKYVGDKAVGDAIKVNVSFNAVKITMRKMFLSDGIIVYGIRINDGEEEGDSYLSKKNTKQTCDLLFLLGNSSKKEKAIASGLNGKYYSDLFIKNEDFQNIFIEYISITQKEINLPEFTIEYHNITIDNIIIKSF